MRASLYTEPEEDEPKTCIDEESELDAPWDKMNRRLKGLPKSYWVIPKVKLTMKTVAEREKDTYLVQPYFIIS